MNRIRSAVDVYQENIHLRKELETMNEKFSKLKTENTELSIRYNYFKIVPDKFLGTNIDTLSKDRMYEYKSKIKKALNLLNTNISKLGICMSSVNFRKYDQGDIFNQFSITYSTLNE